MQIKNPCVMVAVVAAVVRLVVAAFPVVHILRSRFHLGIRPVEGACTLADIRPDLRTPRILARSLVEAADTRAFPVAVAVVVGIGSWLGSLIVEPPELQRIGLDRSSYILGTSVAQHSP